jgi:hypothetical protein
MKKVTSPYDMAVSGLDSVIDYIENQLALKLKGSDTYQINIPSNCKDEEEAIVEHYEAAGWIIVKLKCTPKESILILSSDIDSEF